MSQDDIRANFLLALDRSEVDVTSWEAGFLDSCLGQLSFSRKQAAAIDRMMGKYENQLTFTGSKRRTPLVNQGAVAAKEDVEAQASEVMPEPSVAVKQYLAAGTARRFTLWHYLMPSEQQALIKAGKK